MMNLIKNHTKWT